MQDGNHLCMEVFQRSHYGYQSGFWMDITSRQQQSRCLVFVPKVGVLSASGGPTCITMDSATDGHHCLHDEYAAFQRMTDVAGLFCNVHSHHPGPCCCFAMCSQTRLGRVTSDVLAKSNADIMKAAARSFMQATAGSDPTSGWDGAVRGHVGALLCFDEMQVRGRVQGI